MRQDSFYISNHMTVNLEMFLSSIDTLEELERRFPQELLDEDAHVGNYLSDLLYKYDRKASAVSQDAMLAASYVGNIINGKKKNPSRNALLSICLTLGTSLEEAQYLLRYAGQAPLYVRRKRDVVIWFGFMKKMDLFTVDEKLRERGFLPLIREI